MLSNPTRLLFVSSVDIDPGEMLSVLRMSIYYINAFCYLKNYHIHLSMFCNHLLQWKHLCSKLCKHVPCYITNKLYFTVDMCYYFAYCMLTARVTSKHIFGSIDFYIFFLKFVVAHCEEINKGTKSVFLS